MEDREIRLPYQIWTLEEMTEPDQTLVKSALQAAQTAYAPYSRFRVGCALRLENGQTVQGSNQENASSPCGTCAERTALNYAEALCPQTPVSVIAIAALTEKGQTPMPVTPCGLCRQALLEAQKRQPDHSIRLLMAGRQEVWVISSVSLLLPMQFAAESME